MFPFKANGHHHNGHQVPFISLRGVVKTYQGQAGPVTALKGIDLEVQAGEFLAVTGKSGAGKTTLVNMITGLDRLSAGEIWVNGAPVHQFAPDQAAKWRGQTVGVVFQTFELIPTLTLWQNVTLPMDLAHKYPLGQQRRRAIELLEQVEIAEHAHKLPSAISGGQQQRVAIARAIANNPPLLVADEPTGSLDSVTSNAMLAVFSRLVAQGQTVILVTHDKDVARRAGRVITLTDGEINP